MDDLVTWLRAQLDDDERVDREEVDAKRRILEMCASRADLTFIGSEFPPGDDAELAAAVLAALALPYADRPGYRNEWKP